MRTDQVYSADRPLAWRSNHARCRIDDHSPLLDGSPQMQEIRALIERIAGKDLVACAIHAASRGRVQHLIRSPLPSWLSKEGLSTARQPDESNVAPARGHRP